MNNDKMSVWKDRLWRTMRGNIYQVLQQGDGFIDNKALEVSADCASAALAAVDYFKLECPRAEEFDE